MEAAQLLRNLVAAVPYKIHTILTDNGIQFCNHERHRYAFPHIFNRVCVTDDPGMGPTIEPLRQLLNAIKPTHAMGFMFPNRSGGTIDLDNLADRVLSSTLGAWDGPPSVPSRTRNQPQD